MGSANMIYMMRCFNYVMLYLFIFILSSPYLCVWRWSCRWACGLIVLEWGSAMWVFIVVFFMEEYGLFL